MNQKHEEEDAMPAGKQPGPSVKDDETYGALRREGNSNEKGGSSPSYEEWPKDDVMKRASELDLDGRSSMSKGDLIDAPRNH